MRLSGTALGSIRRKVDFAMLASKTLESSDLIEFTSEIQSLKLP